LADVHLLPQLADAADLMMPSKLTGMMASGRAIMATARAGTQLARVLEGRGMITPPGDVDAFVAGLVRLVEDRDLRQKMGKEARKYAVEHMDQDQILSRFERSMQIASGQVPGTEQEFATRQRGKAAVAETFAIIPGKAGDD
jgi:colanic acid biosynthesis glycosyl transferase WcaI